MDPKKVKKTLEKKRSERDEIKGRLSSLYEELGKLGFDNIDGIDDELVELEESINKKEKELDKNVKVWQKKYQHYLEV